MIEVTEPSIAGLLDLIDADADGLRFDVMRVKQMLRIIPYDAPLGIWVGALLCSCADLHFREAAALYVLALSVGENGLHAGL